MHLKDSVKGRPLHNIAMLRALAGEAVFNVLPNGLALQTRHTPLQCIVELPTIRLADRTGATTAFPTQANLKVNAAKEEIHLIQGISKGDQAGF